jgi:DNA polymerase-3 subunit epsilon
MLDFVAIDFETANNRPDSACQFALVAIEQGEITHQKSWLVRPPRMYFSPHNIAVHGITPEDVANQPSFAEVWNDCRDFLEGKIIVAHNARFDLGVLTNTLAAYDIAIPRIDFACTRLIAQRCWPGHTSYGLAALAERFQIAFQHHDALEDSRTCAKIALLAAQETQADSFDTLERKLFITRGVVSLGTVSSPKTIKRSRSQWPVVNRPEISYGPSGIPGRSSKVQVQLDSQRIHSLAGKDKPLQGRTIFFTGKLLSLSRKEAMQLASSLGANCEEEITAATDYVVMGQPDEQDANSKASSELAKVATLSTQRDKPIRLLSERQFVQLLPGGLATMEIQVRSRRR